MNDVQYCEDLKEEDWYPNKAHSIWHFQEEYRYEMILLLDPEVFLINLLWRTVLASPNLEVKNIPSLSMFCLPSIFKLF